MDAIVFFLRLAASAAMLATAFVDLLREAVAFAVALMAHLKDDR